MMNCRVQRRGFTLVEVLISIAIALLLILGINQIFSIAQQTSGAGTTLLAATETNRAIQTILNEDMHAAITNGTMPAFVIRSESRAAFRNQQDFSGDADGNVLTLNNPVGTGSLPAYGPYQVNQRIHRTDVLCFFARNFFHRQTGSAQSYVSGDSSAEAFMWYGHLQLADNPPNPVPNNWPNPGNGAGTNNGNFRNPGWSQNLKAANPAQSNPNNFYASQWALGREPILLIPFTNSNDPMFVKGSSSNVLSLLPITATARGQNGLILMYSSLCDAANTSIDQYRQIITPPPGKKPTGTPYWAALCGSTGIPGSLDIRFQANPFPQRPQTGNNNAQQMSQWLSTANALLAPLFVRGCTQFAVDFAGDYVTQDPVTGQVQKNQGPDGQIDFSVDPYTGLKQIRWYGFPRDTENNPNINRVGLGPGPGEQHGVVPLRDVLSLANLPPAPFEMVVPNFSNNYLASGSGTFNSQNIVNRPYICAWGPTTFGSSPPRLIRITIAIDDPAGHLNNELTYQYVFELPQ